MLTSENITFLEVVVLQVEQRLYLKQGIEIVDERDSYFRVSCENATSGGFLTFPAKKSTFTQHSTGRLLDAAPQSGRASERSERNSAELIYIKVAGRHARADRQTDGRGGKVQLLMLVITGGREFMIRTHQLGAELCVALTRSKRPGYPDLSPGLLKQSSSITAYPEIELFFSINILYSSGIPKRNASVSYVQIDSFNS